MPSQSGNDQPAVPNLTLLIMEVVSAMPEKTLFIPAEGFQIEAAVYVPEAPPMLHPGAVICHPHPQYGGDMHNNVVMGVQEALADAGFATLRFNFRGVGRSGGGLAGPDGDPEDVTRVAEYLRSTPGVDKKRMAIVGYSYGAMVGLAAGMLTPGIAALVGISPPVAAFRMEFISRIDIPLLVITGDEDVFCPLNKLRPMLPSGAKLDLVKGADHLYRGYESEAGRLVISFLMGKIGHSS